MVCIGMYKITENPVFNIFNSHVPIKKKYIRANEAPFMSKELCKAILKRSRLRDIFLKHRTDTNNKNYSTQINLCKKLLESLRNVILEIVTLYKLMLTEISGGLCYHYLPKIYQKRKN